MAINNGAYGCWPQVWRVLRIGVLAIAVILLTIVVQAAAFCWIYMP